ECAPPRLFGARTRKPLRAAVRGVAPGDFGVSAWSATALATDALGAGAVVKPAPRREDGHLRVEVEDRGDFTKRLGASYVPAGAGLGLRIVDELCDRWEAASGHVTAWYRI